MIVCKHSRTFSLKQLSKHCRHLRYFSSKMLFSQWGFSYTFVEDFFLEMKIKLFKFCFWFRIHSDLIKYCVTEVIKICLSYVKINVDFYKVFEILTVGYRCFPRGVWPSGHWRGVRRIGMRESWYVCTHQCCYLFINHASCTASAYEELLVY